MGKTPSRSVSDLRSYVSEFFRVLCKTRVKVIETRFFDFTYRYLDDIFSIYIPKFEEWLLSIFLPELKN